MKLKKMLALIIAVAMLLCSMGLTAFAEATIHEVTNDTELATAIKNAVDGDTIKLAAGNYNGGISVGKMITLEGPVDADGIPTAVFSGGDVAIYISKGTIKNIKITDAFRGFYGEPCGNVLFDNVHMTGVTYGFHLVAYSNEPTWIIKNCYVDASWANSFGTYQCDGATIIVENNEFVSTSPYYGEESGSPLVNTFSPKTTIKNNIFGKNAKILIRDSAKNGAEIGPNYYEDGYENALYEDCAEDVEIETYYADREMTIVVEVPKVTVAKIGDVKYATLQEALNVAVAVKSDVTVTILADVDLNGVDWEPVVVNGAAGAGLITVEGNEKTITGLNDMLFYSTWAGKSGLIIKDLTIADSNIVHDENDESGNVGVGAFVGYPQASETITLSNCHLVNSTVNGGHWTGGLIGMAGGYNGKDGPVFMNLTIENCSVTDSIITGKGSAGGIIGHGSCAAWTNVEIKDVTVKGNTITSTGDSNEKAGSICGTVGAAGQATTADGETKTGGMSVDANVSENTVTSNGTTITTIYGRQGTLTGTLEITGGTYDANPISENHSWASVKEGYAAIADLNGNYVAGEAPTATVNNLGAMTISNDDYLTLQGSSSDEDMELSFVMQFLANQDAEDMKTSPYADWYADFVITFTGIEGESFSADGCYLAGYYGDFGWIKVPVDGMLVEEGVRYPVMLGYGAGQKYDYICETVKDFRCAMYLTPEILEANPNLKVNLELSVVDNSKGSDAALAALVAGEDGTLYKAGSTEYVANDFVTEPEETLNTKSSFIRNIKTTNADGEERYQVILFAGIGNLEAYSKAGFEITVNGETRESSSNNAYTKYTAAGVEYYPEDWGDGCEYIIALPINFKPEFKDYPVVFRPFALKKDGVTKVYADENIIDKIYNK